MRRDNELHALLQSGRLHPGQWWYTKGGVAVITQSKPGLSRTECTSQGMCIRACRRRLAPLPATPSMAGCIGGSPGQESGSPT